MFREACLLYKPQCSDVYLFYEIYVLRLRGNKTKVNTKYITDDKTRKMIIKTMVMIATVGQVPPLTA